MNLRIKLLHTLLCIFIAGQISAQDNEKKRIAIYDIEIPSSRLSVIKTSSGPQKRQALKSIPEYLVSYYSNSEQFIIIDNRRKQLLADEKERQKSEDFIDGYVVAQGKQEGYDYIFYSQYFEKDNEVYLRVYDVANESVFCEITEKAKLGMFLNVQKLTRKIIDELNNSCFSIYTEVVRSADKKEKKSVKFLLILAGSKQHVVEGYEFEVFRLETETVGSKSIDRIVPIGEGEIETVEDDNFSILKIKKGGTEIKGFLDSGIPLYCRILLE